MGRGDGTYEFVGHRGRMFGWCLVLVFGVDGSEASCASA